ncbi:MAG: hypothetical protein KDK53_10685 [Maritimibacter sp.]|nr:hypothetical protein [Maritimibacter sp.]
MKRDIVFVTLLAAAAALFTIGDAQAAPNGPRSPGTGPCALALQTGAAVPETCPALAAGVDRPASCPLLRSRTADPSSLPVRARARLHQRQPLGPAWN